MNKKRIFAVLTALMAFVVGITIFNACKKNEIVSSNCQMIQSLPQNYTGYEPKYTNITREAPSDLKMRFLYFMPAHNEYHDTFGWIYVPDMIFCAWPKGNCLPTVVIVSNRTNDFCNTARLFQRYYENDSVSEFFCDNTYKKIFPELDLLPTVLDSIRKGEIRLHHFYNSTDSVEFYIGIPGNNCDKIRLEDLNSQDIRCVLRIKNE